VSIDAPPRWDRARSAIEPVPGWLTPAQARRLWYAARSLRAPAQIVEIGSFRGRSTIVLALAAPDGVPVVAIDPHLGGDRGPQEIEAQPELGEADHNAFAANLERAGVAGRVRHVRRFSQDALDAVAGEIDLLFVDGAHRFVPARADLRRWGARVRVGGRLLVHDSFSSVGVTLALTAEVIGRAGWRYRGRSGSLAEYERVADLPGAARAAEVARGLAELPWFARNLAIKVLLVAHLPAGARLLGHRSGDWPY
jgi:predicted O-methyltransferase YrrM